MRAFKTGGRNVTYSAYSNVASDTTFGVIPAAPSNLSLTHIASGSLDYIGLSYRDNSLNEDGFKIERSPDGITFSTVMTVGENVTWYIDGPLVSGSYYFRVRAFNATGNSGYTNVANISF